ncbi:hypothetical protein [Kiritimatiella glycovorans]|uniref:NADH:ubiquinone oxidoreductase intermediate-associated protein 30 domain-containing protein n=1 Tax=Kiritimatiella glycovorans TaxID=1307763 RepID=A0A0G3EH99_9BACT|nr:hypothetical protein [Kiritimatiella glycovorans]AKJ64200.1 hypothetical protein L21SP4_00938 [Kiritimatiella glycovorans]
MNRRATGMMLGLAALLAAGPVVGLASRHPGDETPRLIYYGVFDLDRDVEHITSHAGTGMAEVRLAPDPKRTGTASLQLDLRLDAENALGRWIYPIPQFRFDRVSFWLETGAVEPAGLVITANVLGGDRQIYHLAARTVQTRPGWQKIEFSLPEDVTGIANDPLFSTVDQLNRARLHKRKQRLLAVDFQIAPASSVRTAHGPIYLDQLEFYLRGNYAP